MKICFFVPDLDTNGGWGRYAAELVTYAKQAGHSVVVLGENTRGGEILPILKRGVGILSSAFTARKYVKGSDIIYALDVYPHGIIAYLASLGLSKKFILGALGTYAVAPLHSWKTSWLAKHIYRKVTKVVAISEFTKSQIVNSVLDSKIQVINPGIDLTKFSRPHLISEETFIIGVGALKYRKGYHISIPAFAKIAEEFPYLKYKIVGGQSDSNYFELLQKLVQKHDLVGRVEFITGISDEKLIRLYQQARLFILTSLNHGFHFEGYGIVFLEAAAAGTPCVGTKGNGIADTMRDGSNGILVPQKDIDATASALRKILSSQTLWEDMSKKGIVNVKNYDFSVKQELFKKMYAEF